VEQLLYSGNIYAVKLEVQAKHDLSSVTVLDRLGLGSLFGMKYERTVESTWDKMANSYPRWLALEVEYTIQYYYPSPVSVHIYLVSPYADCHLCALILAITYRMVKLYHRTHGQVASTRFPASVRFSSSIDSTVLFLMNI
jgi:hypothetical protein